MANQIEKCYTRNLLIVENPCSIKEEFEENDFVDYKTNVSETAITTDNVDSIDCTQRDEIKQYEVSTILGNIKEEIPFSEQQYTSIEEDVKIEEGICADNINIIFDNGLLYCENCHVYYEDYCCTCEMLVHILNKDAPGNTDNGPGVDLPDAILEIQRSFGQSGVFALKVIPAGVKFGPFAGLSKSECQWKIKGGKFVANETKKYLNWMQYVNTAKSTSEQNLYVYQYEDDLYYKSTHRIEEGDELLVYFSQAYKDSLNNDGEMDLIPTMEHNFKDAFACMFCCLGFSSKSYLAQHKTVCIHNADGGFSIEELTQCPFCNIHMDHKEYFGYHMAYCCKRNVRKCIPTSPNHQATEMNERKPLHRQMHKCEHCPYRTKYKRNLIGHSRRHREAKTDKCLRSSRRSRTKESHGLRMETTRAKAKRLRQLDFVRRSSRLRSFKNQSSLEFDYKCDSCDFQTKRKHSLGTHTKTKHLNRIDSKCASCDYKTNCQHRLKEHIKAKHRQEFDYKCPLCEYRTNNKDDLENHTKTVHLEEYDYRCALCSFKSNRKERLKEHVEAKHLKEFDYTCASCSFKTNRKQRLNEHIKTKHLKEFDYKCDWCKFKTNSKYRLGKHIDASHLKKMKCASCEYRTKRKDLLEKHIIRIHLKEFYYKCDRCRFRTNRRDRFKSHIKTVHLKEFDYQCASCSFKTNRKHRLEKHIKEKHTKEKHLRELNYKCDSCDFETDKDASLKYHKKIKCFKGHVFRCDACEFETNSKDHLEYHIKSQHRAGYDYECHLCEFVAKRGYRLRNHIKTKHLKMFDYKCDSCDFKTNRRDHLRTHIKSKHLKEFDNKCDLCEFATNNKYDFGRHMKCRHSKQK